MFYLGIALYLISFFLPSLWNGQGYATGWRCAVLALAVWGTNGWVDAGYRLGVRLTIFGSLINLFAIAYAVLRFFRRAPKARLRLALAILACMPPVWLCLYFLSAAPYVGHAAWIVGLLLAIFGDVWASLLQWRGRRVLGEGNAPPIS